MKEINVEEVETINGIQERRLSSRFGE